MNAFEFFGVGRVVFGRGQFARAGELASSLGRSALVVFNGGEAGSGGTIDALLDQLAKSNVATTPFRQRGEPTVDAVDRALDTGRAAGCDCVIGLGGGSAIDLAKAAAGLLANGGTALDYMEVVGKGQKITKPALPWMAIDALRAFTAMTTAARAAE